MPREDIELTPLQKASDVEVIDTEDAEHEAHPMEAEGWWAWACAVWLTTLSLPLLLFPRFLLFLSAAATTPHIDHRDSMTSLEMFLTTHFGILLVALSLTLIMTIPSPSLIPTSTRYRSQPPGHPLLVPLTAALLVSSFLSYNTSSVRIGPLRLLVFAGNAFTGLWGLWVLLFGGGGHFSRTTGADKRTSAFIFGSKAAASSIKKQWIKEKDKERKRP